MVQAQALRLWIRPADRLARLGCPALLVYTVALYLAARLFDRSTAAFAAAVIAITALFLWVAARTTRGGWRFRQGEED